MRLLQVSLLVLVCIGANISTAKDASQKPSEKSHKIPAQHQDKAKTILRNEGQHHQRKPSNRNWQVIRCNIICPIYYPLGNDNGTSKPRPTTHSTTAKTATTTTEASTEEESSSSEEDEQPGTNITTGNSTGKATNKTTVRKIKFHGKLNAIQKKILVKQLRLANRHGKQPYKFRQFNPNRCQVHCDRRAFDSACVDTHQLASSDEDDSDSDPYVEGEDIPVEATIPFSSQSYVIGGIRPIGPVDFTGWSDFGAYGNSALDPETYFLEDKKRKLKSKKIHKKKVASEKKKEPKTLNVKI